MTIGELQRLWESVGTAIIFQRIGFRKKRQKNARQLEVCALPTDNSAVRAQGGSRGGNSEQKAEIPASGAPVGRAAHARLITILFDDSPPPS